ncbi:DUF5712 family protein [Sphingobacterium sp. Mn56C]|uniref:DUF5712 family protein n=1 Tax=Sphingobacterium sp. Mn56C TaxID=3395261 RepID=UPI003BDC368B
MFINITTSETGDNKGSCGALVQYLEKENRLANHSVNQSEFWFNGARDDVKAFEVRTAIDNNVFKLGSSDSKFFLINISPSRKEIAHLIETYGDDTAKEKLKEFATSIMDQYAQNFKRPGVESHRDLIWYGKLENYRYYKMDDKQVKDGSKKRGEQKEGPQMHVQIIVSRKDATGKIKLSPQNTSKGTNDKHSAKMGQFDRRAFKLSGEIVFDQMFGFHRNIGESFSHANILKNGSVQQKIAQHRLEKSSSDNKNTPQGMSSQVAQLSRDLMMEGQKVSQELLTRVDDLVNNKDLLMQSEFDTQAMKPTHDAMLAKNKRRKKKRGLGR